MALFSCDALAYVREGTIAMSDSVTAATTTPSSGRTLTLVNLHDALEATYRRSNPHLPFYPWPLYPWVNVARRKTRCRKCGGEIPKGQKHFFYQSICKGTWYKRNIRICHSCVAQLNSDLDE